MIMIVVVVVILIVMVVYSSAVRVIASVLRGATPVLAR